MDQTWWCWCSDHYPNSRACLPDFWNHQENWVASWLFSWSYYWGQGFKLWKEKAASVQHHDLHSWSTFASHGWESIVWLFQLANSGDRWSWPLPWSGIPANYEWNHWKFAPKTTNLVIFCYSNKVWHLFLKIFITFY